MTHVLSITPEGHEVDIGSRNGQVLVRARKGPRIFELIPLEAFGSVASSDLTGPLIAGHIHWLDLTSRKVEIRPENQPSLDIELRGVQLKFHVNNSRLPHCIQLEAEVDPNQNIGTWCGFHSKLVLRGTKSDRRTVLVPLAALEYKRDGPHVLFKSDYNTSVGKYVVNEILGRIDCAAEPTLILKKAHIHAMSSYVIPDELTGRTGTEETLATLSSADIQPWLPLGLAQFRILRSIAQLSPRREYYPDMNSKLLKTEFWDPELTTTIQDENYRRLVDVILTKSERLRRFHASGLAATVLAAEEGKSRCQGPVYK
ncbi:hypothetical protein PspLS_09303 [Pyricularia sp. CBS 133598]|nr:hypothetical protein PspLS_09303 [Pyricularia sp. CBS 133598]